METRLQPSDHLDGEVDVKCHDDDQCKIRKLLILKTTMNSGNLETVSTSKKMLTGKCHNNEDEVCVTVGKKYTSSLNPVS